MVCYYPLRAHTSSTTDARGKKKVSFTAFDGSSPQPLPCGQCVGCRLERSRQWATRCYHEASLYENNCFITLTYDDDHLPKDFSLNKKHFQDFMKRLRKAHGEGIRFYHCGEYGDTYGRPHYHALIFNFDFNDKVLFSDRRGVRLYVSEDLRRLWPFGFSSIGDVTFESAAYVARYIMKKVNGDMADEHYEWIDEETGEILKRQPEYTTMSRRPGIGKDWIEQYFSDVYPSDKVVVLSKDKARKVRPPRYYDSHYEHLDPNAFLALKERRLENATKNAADCTKERLAVRERVQLAQLTKLVRPVE